MKEVKGSCSYLDEESTNKLFCWFLSTSRNTKACLDWFLIQIIYVNHFQLLKASFTKLDRGIVIDKLVWGRYSEANL